MSTRIALAPRSVDRGRPLPVYRGVPTRAELAAELRLFASMLRRHADDPEAQAEAERLEVSARLIERHGLLPARDRSGNTEPVVTREHARVSLRAVAEAVGVSHAFLSQARSGKRRIRRSLAERIARITPDMPANRKTWPLGWVDED